MPKRVIDFDAMWGSDKLAACADWAQAEYAWLYGLADASGCFEITNLRVIWGRVAAIRGNFTIERLEQVFGEFQDKGLLFVWEHEGKRYGHWTGSDVPGRLPAPSWRMRLEKFAPPVPKEQLAKYVAKFARGRAALARAGFGGDEGKETFQAREESGERRREFYERQEDLKFEISDLREGRGAREARDGSGWRGIKDGVEGGQGQDLNLDLSWDGNGGREGSWAGGGGARECSTEAGREKNLNVSDSFVDSKARANAEASSKAKTKALIGSNSNANANSSAQTNSNANSNANGNFRANADGNFHANAMSAKELAVWRELRVGAGPVCGPRRVKPEVLERIRRREAARAGGKSS